MLTDVNHKRKIASVNNDITILKEESRMFYATSYDDSMFDVQKPRKQYKMSWEQESKNEQHKKQQERMKDMRKAGREAKRGIN